MDKNAILTSAIPSFLPENPSNDQFNNIATLFHLGVLISQLPRDCVPAPPSYEIHVHHDRPPGFLR